MKQTKVVATIMFILAMGGALAAWPFRASYTGGLIFAACEAALVGALADWFAVVALFRHPLGLRFIPHTAIIPNNRIRIIEGIIAIVEKDWLSLEFIKAKIYAYPLMDRVAETLDSDDGRQEIERLAHSLVSSTLQELKPEEVGAFLQLIARNNIEHIKVSGQVIEQVEASIKNLYADQLIGILLKWAIGASQGPEFERAVRRILTRAAADYSNQGSFFRRISKGLGESLDVLNYDDAARALAHRINRMLVEMDDQDNLYRIKVKNELQELKIGDPDATAAVISSMLKNLLISDAGLKAASEFFAVFQSEFLSGQDHDRPVITYLTNLLIEQVHIICEDEERKCRLECNIKDQIAKILDRYHGLIGKMVREKLESLDDTSLVVSLEARVGDDLQWIRINGTVIGGLVGIIQYVILQLI